MMTTEELVARRVHLKDQAARIAEELEQIDAKLLEGREPGTYDAGDWSLQIKVGARRLNEKLFTERFPVDQYRAFYKSVPDLAAIKDMFSPADLERFQVQNRSSVGVK